MRRVRANRFLRPLEKRKKHGIFLFFCFSVILFCLFIFLLFSFLFRSISERNTNLPNFLIVWQNTTRSDIAQAVVPLPLDRDSPFSVEHEQWNDVKVVSKRLSVEHHGHMRKRDRLDYALSGSRPDQTFNNALHHNSVIRAMNCLSQKSRRSGASKADTTTTWPTP